MDLESRKNNKDGRTLLEQIAKTSEGVDTIKGLEGLVDVSKSIFLSI